MEISNQSLAKLKVSKSNAIINAGYRLSLNELRVVLYGISLVNPMSKEFPVKNTINIRELAKHYGIDTLVNTKFCSEIREAITGKFWEREFSYFNEERQEIMTRRWLVGIDRSLNDPDEITYYYNPLIKDQLQQLSKYTSYYLTTVAGIKSAYGIRIYEHCLMHLNASKKHKTTFEVSIKDLKFFLGLEERYKLYSNFKTRVLEVAKKEINKKSDIKISYNPTKKTRSRAYTSIEFTVVKKDVVIRKGAVNTVERCEKTRDMFDGEGTPSIKTETFEKAKAIAGRKLDIYVAKAEFEASISKKREPIKDIDAYFIGFVKKKIS